MPPGPWLESRDAFHQDLGELLWSLLYVELDAATTNGVRLYLVSIFI